MGQYKWPLLIAAGIFGFISSVALVVTVVMVFFVKEDNKKVEKSSEQKEEFAEGVIEKNDTKFGDLMVGYVEEIGESKARLLFTYYDEAYFPEGESYIDDLYSMSEDGTLTKSVFAWFEDEEGKAWAIASIMDSSGKRDYAQAMDVVSVEIFDETKSEQEIEEITEIIYTKLITTGFEELSKKLEYSSSNETLVIVGSWQEEVTADDTVNRVFLASGFKREPKAMIDNETVVNILTEDGETDYVIAYYNVKQNQELAVEYSSEITLFEGYEELLTMLEEKYNEGVVNLDEEFGADVYYYSQSEAVEIHNLIGTLKESADPENVYELNGQYWVKAAK